jgi:hypothetical protein
VALPSATTVVVVVPTPSDVVVAPGAVVEVVDVDVVVDVVGEVVGEVVVAPGTVVVVEGAVVVTPVPEKVMSAQACN